MPQLQYVVAAQAADDFLLMMGGLVDSAATTDYPRMRPLKRKMEPVQTLPKAPTVVTAESYRRAAAHAGTALSFHYRAESRHSTIAFPEADRLRTRRDGVELPAPTGRRTVTSHG